MLNFFSCAYFHLHILFGEVSTEVFTYFLIGSFIFLLLSFKSSFYILDTSSFSHLCFAKTFSLAVVFFFLNSSFWRVEFENFGQLQLISLVFGLGFWCSSWEIFAEPKVSVIICRFLLEILQFQGLRLGLWSVLSSFFQTGARYASKLMLLHVEPSGFSAISYKDGSFSLDYLCTSVKKQLSVCLGLFLNSCVQLAYVSL